MFATSRQTPHIMRQIFDPASRGGAMFQRFQDEEPFHSRGGISQAMEQQRQRMREEINRLPESQLKSAQLDQLSKDCRD
jgi:hypothetical protein